eukprot:scaffold15753_cov48-Attheya_sp.AAC.3
MMGIPAASAAEVDQTRLLFSPSTLVVVVYFLVLLIVVVIQEASAFRSPTGLAWNKTTRGVTSSWCLFTAESNLWERLYESTGQRLLPAEEDMALTTSRINAVMGGPIIVANVGERRVAEDFEEETEHDDVHHFCFLVHGHRGRSRDLSYLHSAMTEAAGEHSNRNRNENAPSRDRRRRRHHVIVHNAVCNEHRTADGIEKGGNRLVEEIVQVIRKEMEAYYHVDTMATGLRDVTISLLGNSLGGVYARYAVAKLQDHDRCRCNKDDNHQPDGHHEFVLDHAYRVHYNVFCTTASPHLGVSRHTYVRIPRGLEMGVAHAMGSTGRDLFRLNQLLRDMALQPNFLEPLGNFRTRIAYANAYKTDFPVPVETAAFLTRRSRYPHHFRNDDKQLPHQHNNLIIATLHTPPQSTISSTDEINEDEEELVQMSNALDALGWRKVFVDFRGEIPWSVSMPFAKRNERMQSLRQRRVVESRDVVRAVSGDDHRTWTLPLGHNMICAFSRSRRSTRMNKGGQPLVDDLAKKLMNDILSWPDEPHGSLPKEL